MLSSFFILSPKGEPLIVKLYGDAKRTVCDNFNGHVVLTSSSSESKPLFILGNTAYFYTNHNGLWFVVTGKYNADASLAYEFLNQVIQDLLSLLECSELDAEMIRNHYIYINQLLEEMIDFGLPQFTDVQTLKQLVHVDGYKVDQLLGDDDDAIEVTEQISGPTPWRQFDIKYKKNEVYVDVVERLDVALDSKGDVINATVDGQITMRAKLSGMPECKLGLNNLLALDSDTKQKSTDRDPPYFFEYSSVPGYSRDVHLDNCQFHQCVRLKKYEAERSISFIPPDDSFEIMKYRSSQNIQIPFHVRTKFEQAHEYKVSFELNVRATFSEKYTANAVIFKVPVPPNTASVDVEVSSGKAKFVSDEQAIIWKIRQWPGESSATFKASAFLTSQQIKQVWIPPPISLHYQILMFTASGLSVKFLKVYEKSSYHSTKWVRYLTSSEGSFLIGV